MNNIDRIRQIVIAIQQSNVTDKSAYFEHKYANFKKKYPMLFELACKEEKMDMGTFEFMLSMLQKMKTNDLTQHDASVNVGQLLYDKYIHDNIKDLPPTK